MRVELNVGLQLTSTLEDTLAWQGRCVAVVCIAICCGLVGCGKPIDMVPVHGQVFFRGDPLEYGSVMFQPTQDGELARAQIQADGTFVLTTKKAGDGVHVGTSRIRITAYEAQRPGAAQAAGNEEMALGRSAIPTKYQSFGTSELTVEVSAKMELPVILQLK